eukprot:CAMPEP_0170170456 /NCGR_PEP_ID=MMETSP0040_2-20121228/3455_1 /TAXON_ID=641309 /ORGANISM="Lotharella oceanica, Strain CCMP622" /LENGTH=109 /DNA_ID=CAMNT_0010409871 /DNA_START=81 /DNA_END=410 /DNA_ORIENTATION=+
MEILRAEFKKNDKDIPYDESKVPTWTNSILEKTMKKLDKFGEEKAYKFAATCTIMQRTGDGIHSATSCFWDKTNDEVVVVKYPKTSKFTKMVAIVTIFATSMYVEQPED